MSIGDIYYEVYVGWLLPPRFGRRECILCCIKVFHGSVLGISSFRSNFAIRAFIWVSGSSNLIPPLDWG